MITDLHVNYTNQPRPMDANDYVILKYEIDSTNAKVQSRYTDNCVYIKYYPNGQFEFLNSIIIKSNTSFNNGLLKLCDFGVYSDTQPLAFISPQDIVCVGRPATGNKVKLLRLRLRNDTVNNETHQILYLASVYDTDANNSLIFYNNTDSYTFSTDTYIEFTTNVFTTNERRFYNFIPYGVS